MGPMSHQRLPPGEARCPKHPDYPPLEAGCPRCLEPLREAGAFYFWMPIVLLALMVFALTWLFFSGP